MAAAGSLLFPRELGIHGSFGYNSYPKGAAEKGHKNLFASSLQSHALPQESWSLHLLKNVRMPLTPMPGRCNLLLCRSLFTPNGGNEVPVLKTAATVLTRSYEAFHGRPLVVQLIPAAGIIAFAAWGLQPLIRWSRVLFLQKSENSWDKSTSNHVVASYVQPLLLWGGAVLICRALDPIILPSTASQAVKQRLLNFVRSLSTVLAFAYCLSSLIRQTKKFFGETKDSSDTRTMGFDFAGKAVYSAVWVASISLFMELLGFSTQKWVTAGGLGTVLLTLAGREIFTNFLSSVMIHATRPFVLNEWIQTKIEGYEVSGTVEHVGWWSPTVIRGDDREAVHIPNHKFTVNVVRNLSQKTHWRIKTHLAISHLDVNKVNNIVADMRKVLAKNPQVEQQKLHRRIFLDNVDRENQALLIMVSCFVKTSHFEEYLCVKEAILLDLLRVISHHRARLATPIRTVQKIYSDADIENIPFSDTIYNRNRAAANSLLLIEPSYKINGEEKGKPSSRPASNSEASDSKVETKVTSSTPSLGNVLTEDDVTSPSTSNGNSKEPSEVKTANVGTTGSVRNHPDKSIVNPEGESSSSSSSSAANTKQESEKPVTSSMSALEDNIVLGVALEGSKRTLPIEDESDPSPPILSESKELAAVLNGSGSNTSVGKDKKDDQASLTPGATPGEQREQEKR